MSSFKNTRAITRSLEQNLIRGTSYTTRPASSVAIRAVTKVAYQTAPRSLTQRSFSISHRLPEQQNVPSPSGIPPPKQYSYEEISDIVSNPHPNQILIDVREPSELLATGRIPTAKSVPISSGPDAFFLNEEDFEAKFSFERPGEKDEVIFYCRSGVRSRQAAALAGQARPMFGGKIGNYSGSWLDWEKNGGKIEKEGEQGAQSSVSGVTDPGQGRP